MSKKYKKSLLVFRRDLRLFDNSALLNAAKLSDKLIPCFIFDPRQVQKNEYKSENATQFLIESVYSLQKELEKEKGRLFIFFGEAESVIERLIYEEKLEAVFINKDYTPFSKKRDSGIQKACSKYKIDFCEFDDLMLNHPLKVLKDDSNPYTVFTHYFNKASQIPVCSPESFDKVVFYTDLIELELKGDFWKFLNKKNENLKVSGGRENYLNITKQIKNFKNYQEERDFPDKASTTNLSPYLKFGICSPREVYYLIADNFDDNHLLIKQLYWRDFFTQIAFHFPGVFGKSFHDKYENIKWSNNKEIFQKWCVGETGFPIVDAGMRELNTTGYMHNRVRMIVSSFLTKDLHIDWRWGEKYFAQKLVDYDPSLNNGNWQWAASTGCDAQPYFRIFNPWLQQKRFDPSCNYIKQWIPELKETSVDIIHNLFKSDILNRPKNYLNPVVEHDIQSKLAKKIYSDAANKWLEN